MWTCGLLKENARSALRGRYWPVVAVCLIASILGGTNAANAIVQLNLNISNLVEEATSPQVWTGNYPQQDLSYAAGTLVYDMFRYGLWVVLLIFVLAALAVGVVFRTFVGSPAQAGLYRYMMENRQGGSPLGTLFTIFRTPYLNVVKVLFLTNLKITLGYFLFLVPGIIWGYRYRLVPYLMAENPYLSTGHAMELSRQMMHGEKWHSFLLELSFFGWALLCALTLGIGYLFLQPYMQATFAELYAALRSKALAYGYTDESELGGFVYHQPQTGNTGQPLWRRTPRVPLPQNRTKTGRWLRCHRPVL